MTGPLPPVWHDVTVNSGLPGRALPPGAVFMRPTLLRRELFENLLNGCGNLLFGVTCSPEAAAAIGARPTASLDSFLDTPTQATDTAAAHAPIPGGAGTAPPAGDGSLDLPD
jgi:hypothetical protein